jgi:hypothetical protein
VWNSGTQYAAADGVSFGGSSYIALQANINTEPDTDVANSGGNWALLAQRGAIATIQSMHNLSAISAGTTQYLNPGGSKVDDPTEIGEDVSVAPLACNAASITVKADSTVSPLIAVTYTLRVGTTITAVDSVTATSDLADTLLSCQMNGSNFCTASGSVPIAATNIFDISASVQFFGASHAPGAPVTGTPAIHDVAIALVCQ